MNTAKQMEIELWLLCHPKGVRKEDICARFDVDERQLRRAKGKPGLITLFCITTPDGLYKHVRHATEAEFAECDRRERKHNASTYLSLRARRNYRRAQLTHNPAPMELFTGQLLTPP